MNYTITPRTLHFLRPATTSRGVYTERRVWYVALEEDGLKGVGECAPLPDLSLDALPDLDDYLHAACRLTCQLGFIPRAALLDYPSILFALETALRALREAQGQTATSEAEQAFLAGRTALTINGLVWMGSYDEMRARLEEKLAAGFRCVKLKIGAIRFADELALLRRIRDDFPRERVELRVDANGAFQAGHDVDEKLEALAAYDLHSIEQPVRQGQPKEMARLCATSPIPIALDEELIGVNRTADKVRLLDEVRPQYLVLKPSLHGALSGADEWIALAEARGIGWWATSALESNVGLAALARWLSAKKPAMPQGLGTGLLFADNTPPHTRLEGDRLFWATPSDKNK